MKIRLSDKIKVDVTLAIIIVIVVGLVIYFSFFNGPDGNDNPSMKNLAECLSSKSVVYVSTGCVACAAQKEIFGEDFEYLTSVDCMIEGEKCSDAGITKVPTWFIDGKKYEGVQQIETLKSLTGCDEDGS